jgi:hypothetical protein
MSDKPEVLVSFAFVSSCLWNHDMRKHVRPGIIRHTRGFLYLLFRFFFKNNLISFILGIPKGVCICHFLFAPGFSGSWTVTKERLR